MEFDLSAHRALRIHVRGDLSEEGVPYGLYMASAVRRRRVYLVSPEVAELDIWRLSL